MTVLRPAGPGDEPAVLALLPQLADFPLPSWRTAAQVAGADTRILLDALTRGDAATSIIVAQEPDGAISGFIFTTTRQDYFTGQPHAHIEALVVRPDARGRGLARRLIDAAESWARQRGYASVTLNVFATNERAAEVYRRLGFRPETVRYIKPMDLAATRGESSP